MVGRARAAAALAAVVIATSMATSSWVAAASKPVAWFDQPLPGMTVGLGPVSVTIHAAFDSGVSAVRFLVDDESMAIVGAPTGDLVTVEWSWMAVSVGQHVITAVAVGGNGMLSSAVSVGVTVVPRDQLPPTPAPSSTPGPGTSGGPTGGPGATKTPGPGGTGTPPTPPPCDLGIPVNVLPADNTTFQSATELGIEVTVEWAWSGDPDCLGGYTVGLILDQQIPDYAADGYQRTFSVGPDTTFYTFPLLLMPDMSDAPPCGFYQWQVSATDQFGDAGEPSPNDRFKVCYNPDG